MKRKIFPIIAAITLMATTIIPASAATVRCRTRSLFCFPNHIFCSIACPEAEQKPSVPETPDTEQTPSIPNVPETPEIPETPETPEVENSAMSQLEREATRLVNERRTENGLKPLTISEELSVKARVKSADMKENNYFSHNSPTYGSPFALMQTLGIHYRSAAENIAMGYRTAEAVVNAWMNSPSHRANILSSNYTSMGIGHVDGYWTQWFTG